MTLLVGCWAATRRSKVLRILIHPQRPAHQAITDALEEPDERQVRIYAVAVPAPPSNNRLGWAIRVCFHPICPGCRLPI